MLLAFYSHAMVWTQLIWHNLSHSHILVTSTDLQFWCTVKAMFIESRPMVQISELLMMYNGSFFIWPFQILSKVGLYYSENLTNLSWWTVNVEVLFLPYAALYLCNKPPVACQSSMFFPCVVKSSFFVLSLSEPGDAGPSDGSSCPQLATQRTPIYKPFTQCRPLTDSPLHPAPHSVTEEELHFVKGCLQRWRTEVENNINGTPVAIATISPLAHISTHSACIGKSNVLNQRYCYGHWKANCI